MSATAIPAKKVHLKRFQLYLQNNRMGETMCRHKYDEQFLEKELKRFEEAPKEITRVVEA